MPSGGGGKGANDVRAGGAFVELFTKDNLFYRGLLAAEKRLKQFGAFAAKLGLGIAGVGTAVLGPLTALTTGFLERGDEMKKAADRLGTTPEAISALGYAAEASGASLEDVETAVKSLFKAVHSEEGSKALGVIGVSPDDLEGKGLVEQMEMIAEGLSGIREGADRGDLALKIFGKGGLKLLPLLKDGAEGIRELTQEAGKVGAIVDKEQAAESEKILDDFSRAYTAVKYAILSVGAAIIPHEKQIKTLVSGIVDVASMVREWIAQNRGLILIIAAVAAGVVAAGLGLVAFGAATWAVGAAIGGIVVVAKLAAAAVMFLLSPFGLVTAAVVGGTAAFLIFTETGQKMTREIGSLFSDLGATISTTWAGITDALKAGDLALAGKIAFAGLELAWRQTELRLTQAWIGMKQTFVDAWYQAAAQVKVIISGLESWLGEKLDALGFKTVDPSKRTGVIRWNGREIGHIGDLFGRGGDSGPGGPPGSGGPAAGGIPLPALSPEQRRILAEEAKRQEAANAFRDSQIAAVQAQLEAAQAELDRLRKEAVDAAEKARAPKPNASGDSLGGGDIAALVRGLAKGLFQGPFSQALGISEKTVEQKIEKNTAATAKAAMEMVKGIAALGMTWK